jgi:hypothetical protein
MKYFLFVLCSAFIISASAQSTNTIDTNATPAASQPATNDNLSVNIAAASITMDTQQGPLTVMIPQVTLRDAQKDWQHYVGKGSKGKSSNTDGEYTQYAAVNKNISADPFNITARLLATTSGVKISVWLSDNNNFQNNKTPSDDRNQALQKYIHDFAVQEYRDAVMNELKGNQQQQKMMENDMTKLVKEEEKAAKGTEANKRAIKTANDAITTRKKDIVSITAKIESQKAMVDNTAADPNATKGAKKTLNELENEKANLQRQNDKEEKDIVSWNNEIRANDRYITDTQEKEATKRASIDKQKQATQITQAKLDGIK